jgi:hypothetical protein
MSAQPAGAYTPKTPGACSQIKFPTSLIRPPLVPLGLLINQTDVRVVLHVAELPGGVSNADLPQITDAIAAVNAQVNQAGATSITVQAVETTTEPFVYQTWFGDTKPTIHIGFVNALKDNRIADTSQPVDTSKCEYNEAHIAVLNLDVQSWTFGTPGDEYYKAEKTDAAGAVYFRPSYLHELLHTFGLDHTDDSYAFMNYGNRPWANRAEDEMIRPLPDDVEALRDIYPASPGLLGPPSRSDVAVLNTWFDSSAGSVTEGAATQLGLCAPSLGDDWTPRKFATRCGVGGPNEYSTSVCPGDVLRTRSAFANYSTDSVDLTAHALFSLDDHYDWHDVISGSQHPFTVSHSGSSMRSQAWTVPAGLNSPGIHDPIRASIEYHVIIRVLGTTASGVSVEDWIPLRGTVQATLNSLCDARQA